MSVFTKVLRAGEGKKVRRLAELVPLIGALEPEMQGLGDDALAHKTVEFKERLERGESLDDLLVEAYRRGARGGLARAGPASLRRPAHGRDGPALRLDRRDEDRRGQDPRVHAARLPQRARRAGRAHGDGERVPRHPRLRVDGTGPPLARAHGGSHRLRHRRSRPQAGRLRGGRHLRHQQRIRLRLPARQHDAEPRAHDPAGPRLCHRRRGRLHPHRRGPHPAHHLGPGRRGGPALLPVRLHRAHAHAATSTTRSTRRRRRSSPSSPGSRRWRRRSASTTSTTPCPSTTSTN